MARAARKLRKRPLWLLPLIAALAIGGFFVGPTRESVAAPPANDTCGTNGANAVPVAIGSVVAGNTTEATNNYTAELSPTPTGVGEPLKAVPADGPDVVYKVFLTDTATDVKVTVKAPFQVSLYAFPAVDGDPDGTPPELTAKDCGFAFGSLGDPYVSDGGFLNLDSNFSAPGEGTTWFVVVDGWLPSDRGSFEFGVTLVNGPPDPEDDGASAVIGSLLKALKISTTETVLALVDEFTEWNFAEGSTRTGFEVFITLASATSQTVTVRYFADPATLPPGTANPIVRSVPLVAGQRKTLRGTNPAENGPGAGIDFSTQITGTAAFQASAILYANRDVGLGVPINGVQNIQGEHN